MMAVAVVGGDDAVVVWWSLLRSCCFASMHLVARVWSSALWSSVLDMLLRGAEV